jgi:uncharacterized protein DUF2752
MKSINLWPEKTGAKINWKVRREEFDDPLKVIIILLLSFLLAAGTLYQGFGLDVLSFLPAASICPFKLLTGIHCPGCGMLRSLIRLSQFEFQAALAYHPFGFLLFPLMGGYLIPTKTHRLFTSRIAIGLLIALILFWMFRLAQPEFFHL